MGLDGIDQILKTFWALQGQEATFTGVCAGKLWESTGCNAANGPWPHTFDEPVVDTAHSTITPSMWRIDSRVGTGAAKNKFSHIVTLCNLFHSTERCRMVSHDQGVILGLRQAKGRVGDSAKGRVGDSVGSIISTGSVPFQQEGPHQAHEEPSHYRKRSS